jgi:hypothetical protein
MGVIAGAEADHDEVGVSVLLTELNVALMLLVSIGTEAARATAIKPTSTAYSTAVGPSSLATKCRILEITVFITHSSEVKPGKLGTDPVGTSATFVTTDFVRRGSSYSPNRDH